jgi:hypothetical protein
MIYIIAALYVLGAYLSNYYIRSYAGKGNHIFLHRNNCEYIFGSMFWFMTIPVMIAFDVWEFFKR